MSHIIKSAVRSIRVTLVLSLLAQAGIAFAGYDPNCPMSTTRIGDVEIAYSVVGDAGA